MNNQGKTQSNDCEEEVIRDLSPEELLFLEMIGGAKVPIFEA